MKVATGCLNLSHSTSSSTPKRRSLTDVSLISSPLPKRRSLTDLSTIPPPLLKRRSLTLTDVTLSYRYLHRSSFFGKKLNRSRSCETLKFPKPQNSIRRIVSASFDSEYPNQIHDDVTDSSETEQRNSDEIVTNWFGDMIPSIIERKANSMDLPFSLRIIQKKKQWEQGFREAGEFAYCAMKKAFCSMVFIIRELQSYTLQMRQVLMLEDLHEILIKVQKEMNASFVWLFQQVFSHTPNLMLCVMILLANYSVYSMSSNVAVSAPMVVSATVESVSTEKTCSVNSGETTSSIGGINGGGGRFRKVGGGTDGDGKFGRNNEHQTVVPDGGLWSGVNSASKESVSGEVEEEEEEEEWRLWKSVVEEAEKMQGVIGEGGVDRETMQRFVTPVTVRMEEEVGTEDYLKTEVYYQTGLLKEPDNPLLLANYAQFLYLFSHDHKRAEEYFKKASEIEPKDAEALHKYASFLWHAKNDLWAAEETFLEAISADPINSFYTATYAHFLWSNGADDTCFPLVAGAGECQLR